jgi:hypothetical protein
MYIARDEEERFSFLRETDPPPGRRGDWLIHERERMRACVWCLVFGVWCLVFGVEGLGFRV